jgi:hypothetical protein
MCVVRYWFSVLLLAALASPCSAAEDPYSGAERLAKKFPLVSVSGGDPPQSEPCDAMSQHGHLGREAQTAQAIRNWMLGREFAREIK